MSLTNEPFNIFAPIGEVRQTVVLPIPMPPAPAARPPPKLDPEVIRRYREDGVAVLRGAIDKPWIDFLRAIVENAMATSQDANLGANYTKEGGPGKFYHEIDVWRRLAPAMEWIRGGPMGELAAKLMGSKYSCFLYDQLFVKEPKTEDETPWHQDRPYWAVTGDMVISFWIPLDPVDAKTCVQYVRGSHRWQEHNPRTFRPGNAPYRAGLPLLPDLDSPEEQKKHEFLSWDMEPGDVIVFNAMTVHGSKGNLRSDTRRRAWAFRFVGEDHGFCDQPGRQWGWPVTDMWKEGYKAGSKIVGHRDHPVVYEEKEGGAKL
ncbi:short chain dehydrogenase [Hyaloraphidium curvatum]|nr:short chain dehydrogenase [Hyaloraphidium curvatum]KAI9012285.1 short chain dehydrogenase [Hyaloraphidium curvatum]